MRALKSLSMFPILCLSALLGLAQNTGWPRVVQDGQTQVIVYQPQPDSLDGPTLRARVAVSIKRPSDQNPVFGALWVSANLDIERGQDLARVASVRIDRTRFADVPDSDVQQIVQFLQGSVPSWDLTLSLSHVKAGLQAELASDENFRNDPPKIIVSNIPSLLILLDGEPRLQDTDDPSYQRVANTAMPVIFDKKKREYWFYGSSVWFRTNDLLKGAWTAEKKVPKDLANLVKSDQTLDSEQTDSDKAASDDDLRMANIIVATEPTELIVINGAAQYTPIVGGDLLTVSNTDSDIFLEVATQRTFVLLSGRWFAAPSLQGPWTFIAPEALPKTFAQIPENSTKASVLAFVPGTERAKDAQMDNIIPQTAEVSRKDAALNVEYDGAPKFTPIANTSLSYAENTPSQVILSGTKYYACENGVWYVSSSPNGPWTVSDTRPNGIENIPPNSPVYNTKYVYIYNSTPDYVYFGYLPGYLWSFPYHGVIFYGTGWHYRGWYGQVYYPRPFTWGYYARYNPWVGWNFGMSWRGGWLGVSANWGWGWAGWRPVGPGYRPGFWGGYYGRGWFGPGGYRPMRPWGWRPPYNPGRPGYRPGGNIYNRPGYPGIRPRPVVDPGRPGPGGRPPSRPITTRPIDRPNNVYVDHSGNMHREQGGSWEMRQDRGWRSEDRPFARPEGGFDRPIREGQFHTEPRGGGFGEGEWGARMRGANVGGFGGGGLRGGGGGGGGRRR